MNFLDLISIFTDTPKEKIGIYVIHLSRAKERMPLIDDLFKKLNITPSILEAVDGNKMVENGHPIYSKYKNRHGNGMIGASCSHVKACKTAMEEGKEIAVIFEDDVVMNKTFEELANVLLSIKNFFNTYAIQYDMFILGALGYPSFFPNSIGISPIYAFDGCHATILKKKTIVSYVKTYLDSLQENKIEAPDGYYTMLLRNGHIGIGFTNAKEYFDQKQEGMWSYIGDLQK